MPRAIETAEILAPALGDLEVRPECDFCEGHPGEADGLTWAELDERYPSTPAWDGNHSRARPAGRRGARSGTACRRALASLVERHPGETVVVACHGGVVVHVDVPLPRARPRDGGSRAWIAPDNSSLTEFRFAPNPFEKSTLPVQLVRYNDHAHLGALDRHSHSISSPVALHRGGDPARVDVVARFERAHGEVDGAPHRLRRAEEQDRARPATEKHGIRIGAARRSSMVSRNATSIVTNSRRERHDHVDPDGTEPVALLALDREVAARASLAHSEERLEHVAAAAQRAPSPEPPPQEPADRQRLRVKALHRAEDRMPGRG